MIKIYSTSTCPCCKQLKDYLKSKNVEFEEIVYDKMPFEEAKKIADVIGYSVPITINGDKKFVGFIPQEIDKII